MPLMFCRIMPQIKLLTGGKTKTWCAIREDLLLLFFKKHLRQTSAAATTALICTQNIQHTAYSIAIVHRVQTNQRILKELKALTGIRVDLYTNSLFIIMDTITVSIVVVKQWATERGVSGELWMSSTHHHQYIFALWAYLHYYR